MPRFAGLTLESRWGLSSDAEVVSSTIYELAAHEGAAIFFTPTLCAKDPLTDSHNVYPRFYAVRAEDLGEAILTRPLSTNSEEVETLLSAATSQGKRKVLSIAASSLEEALNLVESYSRYADALEFDVAASCLLARRDYVYTVELANELHHVLNLPLIVKLPAAIAQTIGLEEIAEKTSADAITVSPNLVYKVGNHIFRLHSPLLSTATLASAVESLSEVNVDVAFITRYDLTNLAELAPIKLYDVTYVTSKLEGSIKGENALPLSWPPISRRLRIYVKNPLNVCPYALIRKTGFVEGCNYCGVCLHMAPEDAIELAAIITPG